MSSPMNGHSEAPTGAANGGGSPSPAAHLSPARSPQLKVGTSAAGPSSGSPKRSQPSSPAFRERSPRREGAVSPLPNSPSNRRMSIPPEQGEQQLQMDVEDAAAGQPEEPFPEILDEFAVEEAEGAAPPEGAEGAAPPDGAEAAAPPEGAEGADAAMEGAEGAAKEEAAPAAPPEPIKPAHIYQTIDDGKVYCFAEKDDDGRPIWHYQDEGGPEMKDLYYCQVVLKSHVEAKDEQGNAIGADTDPGNWIKMLNQDLPLLQQTLGIEIPGAENETAIPGQPIKQQIALFAFDEPNDFMEINRPDAKKIASRLAKGDRRWAVVSDMFEEDRDFLVKRFRHIMHRDIRDWLKALLADGEKQNLLYRTPGAEFKKRFQLDTEKHKFPNCPIFLKSQMTEMFQSQDAISDFLLDCDTGTEKSFVVIIKPDAWTAYLTKCGVMEFSQKVRTEHDVKRLTAALDKRDYDTGLPHWKQALGLLRKFDDLNCPYETFKKMNSARAIAEYRKHDDRSVQNKATELLKKYKKLQDIFLERQRADAQADQEELENLF